MDYIKRYNVLVISFVLISLFTMFLFPREISISALEGANMWAYSVFPALFPFFVCSNMLVDLGFAKFMGELLSPIMVPMFGVSGIGSFPLVSGMLSGYPVGAKITSDLYIDNKLNKKEAQRLLAFCNNCGPLFIIGVIGSAIFKNIAVGYFILLVHILSAIVFGIILNILNGDVSTKRVNKNTFIRRAFVEMRVHTSKEGKTFGQILSDSVNSAVQSSFMVLGFIVLFSVISQIIELFHITDLIYSVINLIPYVHIDEYVIETIFLGKIEMTAGLFLINGTINKLNILIAIFIVTFGGLSVHAQAISFIAKTNLSEIKYICDKFMQAIVSVIIGYLLFPFLKKLINETVPVFSYSPYINITKYLVILVVVFFVFSSLFKKSKTNLS